MKLFEKLKAKLKPVEKEDFYGGDGTWHDTGTIDVQLNTDGEVVAVWFRCRMLPFTQSMKYTADETPKQGMGSIKGIVFEDEKYPGWQASGFLTQEEWYARKSLDEA